MKMNAKELRTLVIENAFEDGRLNKATLGDADYKELTTLYRNALDAITEWASADYNHTSTKKDSDKAFESVKAILGLFTTDDDRIIIDQEAMASMRDCATKPTRIYSKAYKDAHKAYLKAKDTFEERGEDLVTLGAPVRNDDELTADYVARVKESGIDTKAGEMDMLEMYLAAESVLAVKIKAEQDVKDAGKWRWKRAMPVSLNIFSELIENYVADCLVEGHNMKSSKQIREEKKAEKAANAENK